MLRSLLFNVLTVRDWKVGGTVVYCSKSKVYLDGQICILASEGGQKRAPRTKSLEKVCKPKTCLKSIRMFVIRMVGGGGRICVG